jgi:hypothetical protein
LQRSLPSGGFWGIGNRLPHLIHKINNARHKPGAKGNVRFTIHGCVLFFIRRCVFQFVVHTLNN